MTVREANLVLTVDAGGSGVKASVLHSDEWRVVGTGQREYRATHPQPDRSEFDCGSWWAEIQGACQDAVLAAAAPAGSYIGVTCTGMRIPFVLLDRSGEPVAPGVLNLDRRGQTYLSDVQESLGRDALYHLTGHWPTAELGLPKLLWFARSQPALWSTVRHVLQFHDWILYGLCGAMTSEPSSAAMGQLVDIRRRVWATDLLEALNLDPGLLPDLRDAGSPLAGLSPKVARAIGLHPGTPVHVGGGDTHMACLGVGSMDEGDVTVVAGSTTPIQFVTNRPVECASQRPFVSPHLQPGRFAVETNTGASGIAYKWLRDLFSFHSYEPLDAAAAASPLGARELLTIAPSPAWGEESWGHKPPVTLIGVTPAQALGDLARSVLEAICYAVRGNLETLEISYGRPFRHITITGGMARSTLWTQMLADVIGRPVRVAEVDEPAAVAGARLVLKDHPDLWRPSPPARLHEPTIATHRAYEPHYRRYVAAYEEMARGLGD